MRLEVGAEDILYLDEGKREHFRQREQKQGQRHQSEPVCNLGMQQSELVLHSNSNLRGSSELFSTSTPKDKKDSKVTIQTPARISHGERKGIIHRNGLSQVLWGSFLLLYVILGSFSLQTFFFPFRTSLHLAVGVVREGRSGEWRPTWNSFVRPATECH